MKIRMRLIILAVVFPILGAASTVTTILYLHHKSMEKQIGSASLEFARAAMDRIQERLFHVFHLLEDWSANPIFRDRENPATVNPSQILAYYAISGHAREFQNVIFVSPNGRPTGRGVCRSCKDHDAVNHDLSHEPWFIKAVSGKPAFRDVTIDSETRAQTFLFALPVITGDSITGVLAATIRWDEFDSTIQQYRVRGNPQNLADHIMLTRKDGLVISGFNSEAKFHHNLIQGGLESARRAHEGQEGWISEISEHGLQSLSAYTHSTDRYDMPNPGWLVVLLQNHNEIFADDRRTIWMVSIATLPILLLVLTLSIRISRQISIPIQNAVSAMEEIGSGNLDRRVPVTSTDEIGRMAHALNTMADNLKVSMRKIADSDERFRQVAEISREWIWEVDSQGLYTYASPVVEEILGYRPDEIVGRVHFYDLFHPDDRGVLTRAILDIFRRKTPFREFINKCIRKDGSVVWLSTTGIPIIDSAGNLIGYRGSDTDITDRKQAQQKMMATEKLSALGRLSAGIIHEMNQPLNAIKNFCQGILLNIDEGLPVTPATLRHDLGLSVEQVNRMAEILNDMRIFTRKEKEHLTDKIFVNRMVRYPFTFLTAQLKTHNIKVVMDMDPDEPMIMGNEHRLQQVVINIIINARDAIMEKRKKQSTTTDDQIYIRTICDQNAGQVRIEFEDTGIGIPEESIENIFEPFYTTKAEEGYGTGLGLAIASEIVRSHGGEITVTSEYGKGAKFKITFPIPEQHGSTKPA